MSNIPLSENIKTKIQCIWKEREREMGKRIVNVGHEYSPVLAEFGVQLKISQTLDQINDVNFTT